MSKQIKYYKITCQIQYSTDNKGKCKILGVILLRWYFILKISTGEFNTHVYTG